MAADTSPSFEDSVLPLFQAKRVACHSADTPQNGLDLTTLEAMLRGGRPGPAIQPGSAAKSLLMEKLVSRQMPPAEPKPTPAELDLVRRWIDRGTREAAAPGGAAALTEADVRPILQARCIVCHGKRHQEGGLGLRTVASRLAGGSSGPALVPGEPDASLLIQEIESGAMPPVELQRAFTVRYPTEAELATLRAWIADGARARRGYRHQARVHRPGPRPLGISHAAEAGSAPQELGA